MLLFSHCLAGSLADLHLCPDVVFGLVGSCSRSFGIAVKLGVLRVGQGEW